MKNILRLKARGHLTETQVLTAARFFKAPNTFNLAPSIFRILREIIIDEIPLEQLEERRGWCPRSAKVILSVLLYAIEEVEGLFWSDIDQQAEAELLRYLHDEDGDEITALMDLYKLTRSEASVMAVLTRNIGKPVSYETIVRSLYPSGGVDDPKSTLKVFLSKIRAKLSAHHLKIRTIYGSGIVLEQTSAIEDMDLEEWQRLRADGWTYERIAQKFGCNLGTIRRALNR